MENKNLDLEPAEDKLGVVSENSSNPIFSGEGVIPISSNDQAPQEIKHSDSKFILGFIEENQPISVYRLAKKINVSYATTARVCKALEFVGLVKSRMEIAENNRAVRIMFTKFSAEKIQGEPSPVKSQGEASHSQGVQNE